MTTDESRPAYVWSQHLLDYWAEWAPRMRNESDWKWLAAHILQIYIDGQPAAQSERRKGERRNQLCAIWYEKRKADRRQPAAREPEGQWVPKEPNDAWAERFCELVNWHPDGTENRFAADGPHSITFRDMAKNYISAMLRASEPAEGGA